MLHAQDKASLSMAIEHAQIAYDIVKELCDGYCELREDSIETHASFDNLGDIDGIVGTLELVRDRLEEAQDDLESLR